MHYTTTMFHSTCDYCGKDINPKNQVYITQVNKEGKEIDALTAYKLHATQFLSLILHSECKELWQTLNVKNQTQTS